MSGPTGGSSAPKSRDDGLETWSVTVLWRSGRAPDVHKTRDPLMRGQPKGIENAPVVGVPFGDPARSITHCVRGEDKAHGGGPRGQLLLPFGNFHMWAGTTDDGNHKRRAGEPVAFKLELVRGSVGMIHAIGRSDSFAGSRASVAFKQDESPGRELAMIGHARSDPQQRLDFIRRWARPNKLDWLYRTARLQKL